MHVREAHGETRELPVGTVTFLFTDIEGSTRLLQRVGPRYREVLEEHARLIRQSVAAHDGVEVSTEGDAFFVVFDRAASAVAAALGAQRALFGHTWPEGTTVRVRMGLHTGEGNLGGDDYVGLDVHRAARIASAAYGGQVLVSAATGPLVEGALPEGASLRDLGEHRLKDLEHPERLLQVVAPGLPAEFPPLQTTDARPHNLPVQATSFLGRQREVREIEALLTEARLVTLTGPGGTGKTRLALQVGRSVLEWFPDGVFLVRLEALEDSTLVTTTIAQALGVGKDGDRPVAETLRGHLAARELLLILDNFEHLLEATPQVAELLEAAPEMKVLATSRAPLRLRGEHEYSVPPLQIPRPEEATDPDRLLGYEGVDLFVRRAREVDPRFALTEANASAVGGIVEHLDGLPLALELAAARVKLLPPRDLLDRLSDRLSLLTAGPTDAPDRHRTLRNAVAWSHELLEPPEQALCWRLGIFAGSFTLEAAEVLAAGPPVADVLGGISVLIDASLLGRRVDVEQEVRFQMLETIRVYTRERLVEAGEEDELVATHTEYFLERAERAARELARGRQGAWLGRLELDHDDLRAVLGRSLEASDPDTGLLLGRNLWRFWQFRGHLEEGRDWLERLLELPGASADAQAGGLLALAGLVYWQGDMEEAGRLYREALSLTRELEDAEGIVEALASLGVLALRRGDQGEAGQYLEEASGLAEEVEDPSVRLLPSGTTGMSRLLAGDAEGAEAVFADKVEETRRLGADWLLGQALIARGGTELTQERYDRAEETAREALGLFFEAGDLVGLTMAFELLGVAAVARGEPVRGVRLAGAAQALGDQAGIGLRQFPLFWENPRKSARKYLTKAESDRAWEEGLAMELDEALAYAREATTSAARD